MSEPSNLNPCIKCGNTEIIGPYIPEFFDTHVVKCKACKRNVTSYWAKDAAIKWNDENPLPMKPSEPSSEAMAAAEDVLRTMQESRGLEYADPIDEIELGLLATALDDHTAALRAEVEAGRARVAELEAPLSEEIRVVEARMEAQRKRLMRHRIQGEIKKTRDSLDY